MFERCAGRTRERVAARVRVRAPAVVAAAIAWGFLARPCPSCNESDHAGYIHPVPGFRSNLVLQFLATGWVGLTVGLVADSWSGTSVFISTVYGAVMASFAWFGWVPPSHELEEPWRDLSPRERRTVLRALWRGNDPSDARLAHATALAREVQRAEPPESVLFPVLRAAGTLAVVVIAAVHDAPPGWVAAGAVFPLAIAAFGVA